MIVAGGTDTAADTDSVRVATDKVLGSADTADPVTEAEPEHTTGGGPQQKPRRRRADWGRALALGLLPCVALLLAAGAAVLKWQDGSSRESQLAAIDSVQAAKDSTVALLSYRPDTVDKELVAARDRLTGTFRDSYTSLINDVVIPGAKQKQISAVASVPAAASVTAGETHAVVLLFVDQTTIIDNGPPASTASAVRVTLEKLGSRWLISDFTPI